MWLFNTKSGNTADSDSSSSGINEVTHAERQRNKQIEWLREKVNGIVEVERDKRYRVTFNIVQSPVTLDIALTDRFPFEPPLVSATPFFVHPWVDQQMVVVGSPLLKQFNPHSNLGDIIKQIIEELVQHPPPQFNTSSVSMATQPPIYLPQQMGHVQPSYPPGTPPIGASVPPPVGGGSLLDTPYSFSSAPLPVSFSQMETSPGQRRSSSTSATPPTAQSTSMPIKVGSYTIPAVLPGLSEKSDEQLNKYLKDEDAVVMIDRYISRMDVVKKIQQEMEDLFSKNEEQSRENISCEPQLQVRWAELQEKYLELQSCQENYDRLYQKQIQLLEKYDSKHVRQTLKATAQDADTNSEIIAEDFLDQKIDSATFLQQYLHERKLHHLRSIKMEMLKHKRT